MARTFVWLLLLLNVVYGAWAQGWLLPYGFGPTSQREPQRLARQIRPEAITVLPAAEAYRRPAPTPPEPRVCLQSGLLDQAQVDAVRRILETSWSPEDWQLQEVMRPERWLVYMGKFTNQAELDKKRAELVVIQVSAESLQQASLSPGLSLGAYPSLAQANTALQALSRRGVRTARVLQEQADVQGLRLRLPAVTAALQAQLPDIRAVLPSAVLESCP